MEIILILLIILVAGGIYAATRMPRGRRTGNPTVDERPAGRD